MSKKNRNKILLVFMITTVVLTSSCTNEVIEEEVNGEINEETPVTVFAVENMEVRETFMAIGKIEPKEKFDISTGNNGKVQKVYVEAGDEVSKNDVLFVLDSKTLQNNFNSTESDLRTNRDTLKIQLEDLKAVLDKNEILYEAGGIAKAQLDATISDYDRTLTQYNNTVENYNNQVENLRRTIEDTKVKSPIDGKIAAVYITEGQEVGMELAVQVISTNGKLLVTYITADKLETISRGSKALVYLDGDRDKAVDAEVETLNEVPDEKTGLYKVEVHIDDNNLNIQPGEYGEVDFLVNVRNVPVIPKRSLKEVGEKYYVYLYDEGIGVEKEVKTGVIYKEYVEVLQGLEIGNEIVDLGSEYLEDGEKINKK